MFPLILTPLLLIAPVLSRPASYAEWAADSVIARKEGRGLKADGSIKVSYDDGTFQSGLRSLYSVNGKKKYYDYIVTGATDLVSTNGTINSNYKMSDYNLDFVRLGPTFLYLYEKTGEAKWKKAADTFKKQLETHPRTPEGQFWHKLRYVQQGWLDGIYMGDVFYAHYVKNFQPTNQTAWNDIALQFNVMVKNSIQLTTDANYKGLLYHGYDYSKAQPWASSDRGHCIEVWDRALGWFVMALVDSLEIIPSSNSAHKALVAHLQLLAPRIRDAADPTTGVWWLIMTQPGRAKNYFESSGSSMFIYALLKGIRLGWIQDTDGSILAAAKKGYTYMINNWVKENADGTMNWLNTVEVGSLGSDGTFEYYVSVPTKVNDVKGVSAFLAAAVEYERLKI